jgi:hypothetical protein
MLSKAFRQLYRTQPVNQVAVRSFSHHNHHAEQEPKRIVVTGAAGQIAYATLFRLAR